MMNVLNWSGSVKMVERQEMEFDILFVLAEVEKYYLSKFL